MSKTIHIKPRKPLAATEKWNSETGCLTLAKAGLFTVEILQTDALHHGAPKKLPHFDRVTQDEIWKIKDYDTRYWLVQADKKRDEDEATYNIQKEAFNKKLQKELNSISWCWEAAGKGMTGRTMTHNASFGHGLPLDLLRQVRFPKLLEGGGPAWLEVFTENDPATGKRPHGIFVNATGTPKIIAAEWRDFTGRLITEEIAFGSTVYLHIYTEALYGEDIEVQLVDTHLTEANLIPTPTDKDGQPVQRLDPKTMTRFKRSVSVHKYDATTKPPAGAIVDAMIFDKGKDQISNANVQKCVFPVFIEQAWQFQGRGSYNNVFDSGEVLRIKPTVHHSKIKNQKIELDDCMLKVTRDGILKKGELTGNNPLMVDGADQSGTPEDSKKIDFTFGIFLDGTLNSLYNTVARQEFEERTGKKAISQETIENADIKEKKYRFVDESSYENDLSNPAIIYKNYIADPDHPIHPIFKIYTEGIGTLTTPDENENLNEKDYKNDDVIGYAMGTTAIYQNTGIKAKVHKAISLMSNRILKVMKEQSDKTIGIITVDVFGFSRGAAAARHFVHEITLPAEKTGGVDGKDVPSNGFLGYLLTEGKQTFDRLIIRFAGLYDTVPHHGLKQENDIEDLGLNSINKANYVVHLVAADEHRANFNLAKISSVTKTSPESGKKGGIELYLPGVHCDVGGSYIEGMPEKKTRIDASFDYQELKKLRTELIAQGWFKEEELKITANLGAEITDINKATVQTKMSLDSYRNYLSNQYSLIPLHLMVEFCSMKEVLINVTDILDNYGFQDNRIKGNVAFLKKIKTRLHEYAFGGGMPYSYIEPQKLQLPEHNVNSQDDYEEDLKRYQKLKEKQLQFDQENARKNKDLLTLRNLYLHWNSVYGSVPILKKGIDVATQPYAPNKENGKRKRTEQ